MNPWMLSDLADSHVREMRREATERRSQARSREAQPAQPTPSVSGGRAGLRHRIGFGLVEAGLHVLATTRPAP